MPGAVFIPAQLNDLGVDVALSGVAQGDLLFRGASKWNNLAPGTSGQVLTSGGEGANPSWEDAAAGGEPDLGIPSVDGALLTSLTNGQRAWSSSVRINSSGHLLFPTDNTHDIGASGATRPRTGYFGTNIVSPVGNIVSLEFSTLIAAGWWRATSGVGGAIFLGSGHSIGWGPNSTNNGTNDTILLRDGAANTLALRNGTAAQEFRLYSNYTDISSYTRGGFQFSTNDLIIYQEAAGGGAFSRIGFKTSNAIRWWCDASGLLYPNTNNAVDIGTTTNRPRTFYLATSLINAGYALQKFLVEANTAGSGAPNVLTAAESRTCLTNAGSTEMNHENLPAAAAGLEFPFVVADADGMRINAATGDFIRIVGDISTSGGYCESTTIGSYVRLLAIDDTTWVAIAHSTGWAVST